MTTETWDTVLEPEDDDGLAGRVALIAGGGAPDDGMGNGRASAIVLARRGMKICVVDRLGDAAEVTAAAIRESGGEAFAVEADVTSIEDCDAAVAATIAAYGRLDVVNNNVGVASENASVVDADLDKFDKVMRINVRSVVAMSRAAIPELIKTSHGSIVNVSSISALRPRGLTAYSTSKGAVITLTTAMAIDHAPDGIRVNCVTPGPVYSARMAQRGMTAEMREARRMASPMGVEGTPWDIANAVAFLAGDRSKWITGQSLVVDGGTTLRGPDRG